MEEGVTFTMGETIRYGVIQALLEKRMKNTEAALALGLSIRQVQRIKKKVAQQGTEGILHGNRDAGHLIRFRSRKKEGLLNWQRSVTSISTSLIFQKSWKRKKVLRLTEKHSGSGSALWVSVGKYANSLTIVKGGNVPAGKENFSFWMVLHISGSGQNRQH